MLKQLNILNILVPEFENRISLALSFDELKHPRDKFGKFKIYYHGSPDTNIKILRTGSYITSYLHIAKIMGLHNKYGKVWNDKDLKSPYKFGKNIRFKNKNEFVGIPTIYKIEVKNEDIDFLENPFEHIIKKPIKAIKVIKFN